MARENRQAQGLFRNLKEDILAEAEIEFDEEKEKKRVQNELKKAEDALAEAESAAKKGEKPDAAAKSRLGKVLEFAANGAGKAQELARTYNKVAKNIGLPAVPPLLLGKEKG